MYHHIKDFLTDWEYESAATLKLFQGLTDDSLHEEIHPNVRTLGFLAWHIIHTMQEMMARTGIKIDIKEQSDYNSETAKELCDHYEQGAALLSKAVGRDWKDTDLGKEDEMYGDMWKRGMTLAILVRHQAHHRAEMIIVMRLLGLPVSTPYGPTKEEWAQWGMDAMR